jgi:hypothetical protein
MIQSGGWSRLRTLDEHTKLARISVDFNSPLDARFELNVSKTQVRIPPELRAAIGAIASSVARMAQEVYRSPVPAAPSKHMQSRVDAIQSLVRMITQGFEDILRAELEDPEILSRTLSRIRTLETNIASDIARSGSAEQSGAKEDRDTMPLAAELALISA